MAFKFNPLTGNIEVVSGGGGSSTNVIEYRGTWDAGTNTPTLSTPDITKATQGYWVSALGTQFGENWVVGDWLVYDSDGVIERRPNNSDVVSVNTKTGVVILNTEDIPETGGKIFFTEAEKTKLTGIEESANNYTHPATHPASIIVTDADNRFVTDTEKGVWNGKLSDALSDGKLYGRKNAAWEEVIGGGGVTELADLTDVDVTGITNGQVLVWDTTTSKYIPADNQSVTSVNTKIGDVVLKTVDIAEDTNLYHTTARARGAVSGTSPISYNSSTGAISHVDSASIRHVTDTEKATWNAKQTAITTGTTAQYFRGDLSLATLNTTAVAEGTNLYHTTARARTSVSGSGVISYNSSTGVISHTDSSSVRHVTDTEKETWNTVTSKANDADVVKLAETQTITAKHIINRSGECLIIKGTEVGTASSNYIVFEDSAGTDSGFIGKATTGNSGMYVGSYIGNIHLVAKSDSSVVAPYAPYVDSNSLLNAGAMDTRYALKSEVGMPTELDPIAQATKVWEYEKTLPSPRIRNRAVGGWTARTSAADNQWLSVCWSPELSLFCAVAITGTGNRVMTSPDGINWTARTTPADINWVSVCWSPELGLFCAVANTGTGNRVMTSPDGINWTARTSVVDNQWYSVCWSPELGLFCAVANTGTGNRVMTSPNGTNWTARTSAADSTWRSVCWSPELGFFCAVASTGTGNRVMTSKLPLPIAKIY